MYCYLKLFKYNCYVIAILKSIVLIFKNQTLGDCPTMIKSVSPGKLFNLSEISSSSCVKWAGNNTTYLKRMWRGLNKIMNLKSLAGWQPTAKTG